MFFKSMIGCEVCFLYLSVFWLLMDMTGEMVFLMSL